MAETKQERFPDYPIFKGLQRPLEFFGLQGRYIYWAAATAGGAVVGFILGYCIFGFVAGLVLLVLAVAVGGVLIVMKQRKGLHSKKSDNGILIYAYYKKVKGQSLVGLTPKEKTVKQNESMMSRWNVICNFN